MHWLPQVGFVPSLKKLQILNRIRLWPVGRDDHSGVLIGRGGMWRSGWPARVLANDEGTRID